MKKFNPFSILCVLIISLVLFSCEKDDVEPPVKDPEEIPKDSIFANGNFTVQVIIPAGSAINLEGGSTMSLSTLSTIDAKRTTKVNHVPKSISVAYVFDKNEKLVMAGFISDSAKVISPATTAKVLLYWAQGLQFQPFALTESYLKNIDQIPGAIEWISEFEKIFIGDPMTFSNGSYNNALKSTIEKMIARNPVDIHLKSADITVDNGDIKSGLQVAEDGLGMFSVTNNYRRRAHAFLYKMNYTDLSGNKNTIKEKIDINSTSDKNFPVDPIAGVTSVLGEVGKYIEEDKAIESFAVKTNPVEIKLDSNESESKYKVRIVAPGMTVSLLTNNEDSKLLRLEMETFALDAVIPAISLFMSLPETKESPIVNESAKEKIIETILSLSKNIPDVYEEIKKGNYNTALSKLIENLYKDAQATNLSELIDNILLFKNIENPGFYRDKVKKLNTILASFDLILGTSDIFRIIKHVSVSKTMEEWDITARSSQVKLIPKEAVIVTLTQQKITAEIKNLDESGDVHPFFEWSTSGKYGYLIDTKGHIGSSFESSDITVNYNSNAKTADLSDGNNYEYIYVKAYLGNKYIGTDTAIVNVKKYKYKMTPQGVTLNGKEGASNELALYLEIPKGGRPIEPNNEVDFKVVWSTTGKYGKLYFDNVDGLTTVTTYDDNKIWYDCTDKDTKQGIETIYARIYLKGKDDLDYNLFDEVKGTVNIDNDPKKRILQLPVDELHGDTTFLVGTQTGYNCAKIWATSFPEDKDAKSYQIKFYGAKNAPDQTYSWIAGAATPAPPQPYAGKGYSGGIFTITWIGTGNYGNGWTPAHVNGAPAEGKAQVTIFLK